MYNFHTLHFQIMKLWNFSPAIFSYAVSINSLLSVTELLPVQQCAIVFSIWVIRFWLTCLYRCVNVCLFPFSVIQDAPEDLTREWNTILQDYAKNFTQTLAQVPSRPDCPSGTTDWRSDHWCQRSDYTIAYFECTWHPCTGRIYHSGTSLYR